MSFATDFDIQVVFDLSGTQPTFAFNDVNNYVGNGDSLTGGYFAVTAPTGELIYQSAGGQPDTTSSQTTFNSLLIPTNTQGQVIHGWYSIVYTAETANNPTGYSVNKQFEYQFCSPKIEIAATVDCLAARLQSRDTTSYSVDGIAPSFTRLHEVHLPSIRNVGPTTGNGSLVEVGSPNLYEGVYTIKITSLLHYDFGHGFAIRTQVIGQKEIDVQCDVNLCKIYCCVSAVKNRLERYRCENLLLYDRERKIFAEIVALVVLFEQAIRCGKPTDAAKYHSEIRALGHCGKDCGCEDDEPRQINPILNATVTGTNQWLTGSGSPSSIIGKDGDLYLDSTNGDVYERAGNAWNGLLSIAGRDGVPGTRWHTGVAVPTVALGTDGDFYLNTSTLNLYRRANADWGSPIANLAGSVGPVGPTGPQGLAGPAGPPGELNIGTIIMYSGSATHFDANGLGWPTGIWANWQMCNGNNGSPDLRKKFVAGYDPGSVEHSFPGQTGGEKDVLLTSAQSGVATHTHANTFSATASSSGDHTHSISTWRDSSPDGDAIKTGPATNARTGVTEPAGDHTHTIAISGSITAHPGADAQQAHNNLPPYFTMIFLMKVL